MSRPVCLKAAYVDHKLICSCTDSMDQLHRHSICIHLASNNLAGPMATLAGHLRTVNPARHHSSHGSMSHNYLWSHSCMPMLALVPSGKVKALQQDQQIGRVILVIASCTSASQAHGAGFRSCDAIASSAATDGTPASVWKP